MKVLVACEESQEVCKAFRALGHEAYSCDIQEPSGGHPEWHIMQDVIPLLNGRCRFTTVDGTEHHIAGKWDLIIAHPPCTYFSTAGANWLFRGGKLNEERYARGLEMKDLFMAVFNADCDRIAIENPVVMKIWELPKHTQEIQPYQFGHPFTKKNKALDKGYARVETNGNSRTDCKMGQLWKQNKQRKAKSSHLQEIFKQKSKDLPRNRKSDGRAMGMSKQTNESANE